MRGVLLAGTLLLLVVVGSRQPLPSEAVPVFGVILTVNSANDVDDGTCNSTHCSLREAINSVNGAGPASEIRFDLANCPPACTISPQTPLPTVTNDGISINGRSEPDYDGQPLITIDGSAAGLSGLVFTGNNAMVLGLNIRNNHVAGIEERGGTIVVEDSEIRGNAAVGVAADFNDVVNSSITGTTISGNGVGFAALGTVVVSGSTISGNMKSGIETALGNGALSLTVSDTTISGNGENGIAASGGSLSVTDSTISNNAGTGIKYVIRRRGRYG